EFRRVLFRSSDLVADDRTDRTVVDRVVSLEIEERRLKNAGRERDLVVGTRIRSVHGRRREEPTRLVRRLADVGDIPFDLEGSCTKDVAGIRGTVDIEALVSARMFVIADLSLVGGEFRQGLFLGR